MTTVTIRKLDESTKDRLRVRAAKNKRSMEDEARTILRDALADEAAASEDLGRAIHLRFKALGGVDLELPPRGAVRQPSEPQ
ncbi:MAG: plasmid stabilization protein [Proteobacteria bacterium]|nr:plasmid stabilization protein [Pseudomonadota bacterium]